VNATQVQRAFTVIVAHGPQRGIADAMLSAPLARIVGRSRLFYIYPSTAAGNAHSYYDPFDGTPLITCHHFTSEADARRWCAEQEVH
jgi:hypothetical protein